MKVVPTTDRGRATVGRVLEAACDLFNAQGIRSTTLDEIGTVAGVGRGQLYHFFVDKSDLVAEVVGFQVERVISGLQPTMEAMSTSDDVRVWSDVVVESYAASPGPIRCPLGSLINQLGDDDQAARNALQAGFVRWEKLLEAGLQRVAENGGLRAGVDAGDLAAALLAAYQGGVLLTAVHGEVAPLRRALRGITDVALADSAATISR